ncbi:MAG: hypothetical protein ACREPX_01710 [Rhodanobacteraceae bacterium]
MSTTDRPHRVFERSLRPIGQAVLGGDIEPLVQDIIRRIRHIRLKTQAGAYVLADEDGNVYILREQHPTTENTVRRALAKVVGLYASQPARPTFPTAEQIKLDLIAQFLVVGFVKPAMIYDAVRMEP